MKWKVRQESGLYNYLDACGVLNSNDVKAIAQAKQRYWSMVRNNWNKLKRKRSKAYTVYFDCNEAKGVQRAAKEQRSSVTNFIKRSALSIAAQGAYTDPRTTGEVRELLVNHCNSIEQCGDAIGLTARQVEQIFKYIRALEVAVMQKLGKDMNL